MKSRLHGNHDNHSTTKCFFATSCKKRSKKSPSFKCFLSTQFSTSKLYTLWSNRSVPDNFENVIFMGVGLPYFRERQLENRDKLENAQFSRALKGNFYCLSLNGKNTHILPFWPQMPSLTLELRQKTPKSYVFEEILNIPSSLNLSLFLG